MIRKYYNHKLQTKRCHREKEPKNNLGKVHCTYLGVSGYNFQNNIALFCLKIFLTFTNSVDPDKMQHFIWISTACKTTSLGVFGIQRLNSSFGHHPIHCCVSIQFRLIFLSKHDIPDQNIHSTHFYLHSALSCTLHTYTFTAGRNVLN